MIFTPSYYYNVGDEISFRDGISNVVSIFQTFMFYSEHTLRVSSGMDIEDNKFELEKSGLFAVKSIKRKL
jgi:hypothetical protein